MLRQSSPLKPTVIANSSYRMEQASTGVGLEQFSRAAHAVHLYKIGQEDSRMFMNSHTTWLFMIMDSEPRAVISAQTILH